MDGRKSDSAGSSLYHPHQFSGEPPGSHPLNSHDKQKQGFHNLGYSKSNDGTLKLEADNNYVNRLHTTGAASERELPRQGSGMHPEGALYIIQPEALGPRWVTQDRGPSQVPVYPNIQEYESTRNGWDPSISDGCGTGSESLSVDEIDEGVGGTPEYPCDTGDEGSILSGDVHTSTTSVSSADTRDDHRAPKTPDLSTLESGISVTKSEDEEEGRYEEEDEEEEVQSVTDSMVAEALAALEAATAGEDCE